MLAVGTVIGGRYCVVRALGRGGMGAVYLARTLAHADLPTDLQPGQEVAVKQVLISHLEPDERERAIKAFEQEALLLARLRHANLVRVYEHLSSGQDRYLVMHYINGWTMAQMVRRLKTFLPLPRIQTIARELCEVLTHLHSMQPPVIFRDLKPSNIMLDKAGSITLIDFGIARVYEDETQTQTYLKGLGSAGYSPLEQYVGGGTNPKSDVYSLGATLYTLVTHKVPPPAAVRVAGSDDIKEIGPINPGIPPHWEKAIRKMMRVKPDERFRTVAEAQAALFQTDPAPDETTSLLAASRLVIELSNALFVQRLGLQRPDIAFNPGQAPYREHDEAAVPADVVFCLKSQPDEQCGVTVVLDEKPRKATRFDLGIDNLATYLVARDGKLGPPDEVMPTLRVHLCPFAILALEQLAGLQPQPARLETLVQLSGALTRPEAVERAALLEMDWRGQLNAATPEHWLRLAGRLRAHGLPAAEEFAQKALETWQTQAQGWWALSAEECLRHHQARLENLQANGPACLAWLDLFKATGRSKFKLDWLGLELRWRQSLAPLAPAGVADCMLALAAFWASQMEWDKAEPYASEALKRAENCLDSNSPELSPYLKLYADVCDHCGMSKKSTEYRTRAFLLKHRRV